MARRAAEPAGPLQPVRPALIWATGRAGLGRPRAPAGAHPRPPESVGAPARRTPGRTHEESRMRTHTRRRAAGMALLAAGLGFIVSPRMTAADDAAAAYKPV